MQLDFIRKTRDLNILPEVVTVSQGWTGWRNEGPLYRIPPADFEGLLRQAKDILATMPQQSLSSKLLLLDNWNEWSEGHYLAPHRQYGFGYLDAVRKVFSDAPEEHVDVIPEDNGFGPYDSAYKAPRSSEPGKRVEPRNIRNAKHENCEFGRFRPPAEPDARQKAALARLLRVNQVDQADHCGDEQDHAHDPPKSGEPCFSPLPPRGAAPTFAIMARHAPMIPRRSTQSRSFARGKDWRTPPAFSSLALWARFTTATTSTSSGATSKTGPWTSSISTRPSTPPKTTTPFFHEKDGTDAASQIRAFEDTWSWNQESQRVYQELTLQPGKVCEVMQAFKTFLGTNDMMAYLAMMAPRLVELRRVLKPTGSLYLHCDPTASHYLKLLLDAVFGQQNFRNEIIWKRKAGRGETNNTAVRFGVSHDIILFFARGKEGRFNRQYRPKQ